MISIATAVSSLEVDLKFSAVIPSVPNSYMRRHARAATRSMYKNQENSTRATFSERKFFGEATW